MSRTSSRDSMRSVKSRVSFGSGTIAKDGALIGELEVKVVVDSDTDPNVTEQKEDAPTTRDEQVSHEGAQRSLEDSVFAKPNSGASLPSESVDIRRPFRNSDVGIRDESPGFSLFNRPIRDPKGKWQPMTQLGLIKGGDKILQPDDEEDEEESAAQAAKSLVSCLIILTLPCLVVAGVVLGMNGIDEEDNVKLGYTILAVIGALILLCCAFACCAPCLALASCISGGRGSESSKKHDPNSAIADSPLWVFKRINDRFYLDVRQHRRLLQATAMELPASVNSILLSAEKLEMGDGDKSESGSIKKLLNRKGKKGNKKGVTASPASIPEIIIEVNANTDSSLSIPKDEPANSKSAATKEQTQPESMPDVAQGSSSSTQDRILRMMVEGRPSPSDLEGMVRSALAAGRTPQQIREQLRPRTYLLRFRPELDIKDMAGNSMDIVDRFTSQVSLLMQVMRPFDTVIVDLESPGGGVNTYGLLAHQLVRIKNRGVRLIVCVDKIAASGGYMMACVADRIIAAPFAYIGSIGVVAMAPNVQRALEKRDIDMYVFTAGKYKRTVDVVGHVTEDGKAKFTEELEDIHHAFKEHVRLHRPKVNVEEVATGEAWIASQAKMKGLVDFICSSEEYLEVVAQFEDVLEVVPYEKVKMSFISALLEDDGFGVQSLLNPMALGRAIRAAFTSSMEASQGPQARQLGATAMTPK